MSDAFTALPDRRRSTLENQQMAYLSDVNIRAVLSVLVARAGGSVEITNAELYDAMLPDSGGGERFVLTETADGVRVSLRASRQEQAGSN